MIVQLVPAQIDTLLVLSGASYLIDVFVNTTLVAFTVHL